MFGQNSYWHYKETLYLWRLENVERNVKIEFNKKIANTSLMYEDSCAFPTSYSSKSATECCLHKFMYLCQKPKNINVYFCEVNRTKVSSVLLVFGAKYWLKVEASVCSHLKKNTSINFMPLFMIILGVLNLYYTDAGIKYRTNSVLSVAFHIIHKKILLLLTEKLPNATSRSFWQQGEGSVCVFY